MNKLLSCMAVFVLVSACTSGQLMERGYLSVTPSVDAQHTAFLINKGFKQCTGNTGDLQQTGDKSWTLDYGPPMALSKTIYFTIDVTDTEVRIAPLYHTDKMRAEAGMIGEWVEAGKITTCKSNKEHLAKWHVGK